VAEPGIVFDANVMCGNPGALEQGVEERPRNSARKVYGGRFSAEFFDDARNINS
jgi:hypothetical protein